MDGWAVVTSGHAEARAVGSGEDLQKRVKSGDSGVQIWRGSGSEGSRFGPDASDLGTCYVLGSGSGGSRGLQIGGLRGLGVRRSLELKSQGAVEGRFGGLRERGDVDLMRANRSPGMGILGVWDMDLIRVIRGPGIGDRGHGPDSSE